MISSQKNGCEYNQLLLAFTFYQLCDFITIFKDVDSKILCLSVPHHNVSSLFYELTNTKEQESRDDQ